MPGTVQTETYASEHTGKTTHIILCTAMSHVTSDVEDGRSRENKDAENKNRKMSGHL